MPHCLQMKKSLALSQEILQQFDTVFGYHPGFRPAHAKGIIAEGNLHAFTGRCVA